MDVRVWNITVVAHYTMAFKDLHYSLGKFKTDVRSQLARNNPMQKPDTKALSMWIFEERNDLAAMRVSAYHRVETTKSFTGWIDEHQDEDLGVKKKH